MLSRCIIVWSLALGLLLSLGACNFTPSNEVRVDHFFLPTGNQYSYTVLLKKNLDSAVTMTSLSSVTMLNSDGTESNVTGSVVSGPVTDALIDQLASLYTNRTTDAESLKAAKDDMIYVTIHVPQIPAGDTTFEFTVNFSDGTQTTVSDVVSQLSASFD